MPAPTQATPRSVIAERRRRRLPHASEPVDDEREDERRQKPAEHPVDPAELKPEQRHDEAEVAAEHERAELARHHVQLVQREQAADEREPDEPPAAEVDEPDDERQQDRSDEDPRREGAHRRAEPPPAARVLLDRRAQPLLAEVGPERVVEDELRVGRLPEQEVRDPLLAGRADHEVGIGKLWRVETCGRWPPRTRPGDLTPSSTSFARSLDELRATAVVEGDPELKPFEVRRSRLRAAPSSPAARPGCDRGDRRSACARPASRDRAARGRSSRP